MTIVIAHDQANHAHRSKAVLEATAKHRVRCQGQHRRTSRIDTFRASSILSSAPRASCTSRAIWTPLFDFELVEEAGDVGLDGRDGELQCGGDLGVGAAAADGEGDVALARAERGQAVQRHGSGEWTVGYQPHRRV